MSKTGMSIRGGRSVIDGVEVGVIEAVVDTAETGDQFGVVDCELDWEYDPPRVMPWLSVAACDTDDVPLGVFNRNGDTTDCVGVRERDRI